MNGIRWYIERNRVPQAHEVRAYAIAKGVTMMEAKRELMNESKPRLQFWDNNGKWQDVPTVVEERK